ncbi:MAG: hypothetical protein RL145_65 [Pseudomonadota bacterium]|jgi:hypothetical protein
MLEIKQNRRLLLGSLGALGTSTLLANPLAAAEANPVSSGAGYSFDTPMENVRTMARLTSTLEPGKTGYVRYQGRAFALLENGSNVAIYDIDGIGALRALPQPNGAIRFLFSEFALYLDLKTGLPLERWTNPITGREVEVWHQRNGPVNYEIAPDKAMFGQFARADGVTNTGFQLPWTIRGPFATFALDVVSNRKNALDPTTWPLESSGETIPTTEHSQYSMLLSDLNNPKLLSLPFFATLQSIKPWHPWMLMGQRPGRVFARMVAQKVSGPEVLPAPSLAYAKQHLSAWMEAPAEWTGQYVTAQAIYKATRTPQK